MGCGGRCTTEDQVYVGPLHWWIWRLWRYVAGNWCIPSSKKVEDEQAPWVCSVDRPGRERAPPLFLPIRPQATNPTKHQINLRYRGINGAPAEQMTLFPSSYKINSVREGSAEGVIWAAGQHCRVLNCKCVGCYFGSSPLGARPGLDLSSGRYREEPFKYSPSNWILWRLVSSFPTNTNTTWFQDKVTNIRTNVLPFLHFANIRFFLNAAAP